MWVDEQMLALNVRDRSFILLAGPLWLDQSAPLGWLALERLIMLTLGTGERSVRLLTVLFGIGTLATAVWIGRRWMTPLGATILVALCAFGEWIVFFTLELKHYSSDTLWALLLPALAARTAEAAPGLSATGTSGRFRHRMFIWWLVASAGMWFSNGAVFVTPACAAALAAVAWQIDRPATSALDRARRVVSWFLLPAAVWTASFALCYALVLRPALENAYLKTYWAFAFPPVAGGARATLEWVGAQLVPFAVKPAGSGFPVLFWLAYATGILAGLARRSPLALMVAVVPLSALVLAILHVVPTFERLALWFVPSLYVGIALCADAAAWLGQRARRAAPVSVRWAGPALAAGLAILAIAVAADVVRRGAFALENRPRSNYGLDDRSSVRSVLEAHRPGDVIMSTHYGLAAIWWYGRRNVADPDRSGRLPDGTPMFEIHHVQPGDACPRWNAEIDSVLNGQSRVIVYLGFRMNVEPPGFDELVLEELGRRGALVGYKEYAEESRVAIFDLGETAGGLPALPSRVDRAPVPVPAGCMSIMPARRW
jgi:hypothetical protein